MSNDYAGSLTQFQSSGHNATKASKSSKVNDKYFLHIELDIRGLCSNGVILYYYIVYLTYYFWSFYSDTRHTFKAYYLILYLGSINCHIPYYVAWQG